MLLQSPMIINHLTIHLDLYEVGLDLAMIAIVWGCMIVMVLVQHLLRRFRTAKAGQQCDEERRVLRCS